MGLDIRITLKATWNKEVEEAFRNRVVATLSFVGYAASHLMLGEQFLIINRGVLSALIRSI
jgi:hypothetical protein